MSTRRLAGRFLRSTMLSGLAAAAAAPAAFAQDDDEIIVTGTRIQNANLASSSPVFQVDAGEVDSRGTTRVEDLINILPQAFASQTSEVANGATGTSAANLRNLGSIRTLVLIDGKRLPFGSPQAAAPNLDFVPAQLVERIDVTTGGQSAVYGSDAIAGVVNFILKRDFEGVAFDGQVGFFQDGNGGGGDNAAVRDLLRDAQQPVPGGITDGREVLASVTLGANTPDGRGNVTAFLSYSNQNEIRQATRDYSACALNGTPACVGSTTFRRFFSGGDFHQAEDGTFVDFIGGPDQTFNFGPDNFIQRPNERFNLYTTGRYQITDDIETYLDIAFMDNTTDAQIAFSGSFFRSFQVNCDNPFLDVPLDPALGLTGTYRNQICTDDQITNGEDVGLLFGRRNVEGDPRNSFINVSTFRTVGGFRGNLGENWLWDAFGQFSRTSLRDISQNDLSFDNLQDALFIVDNGAGPECRSGNAGCVPYNVFQRGPNGESLVTDEAVDFIQRPGFTSGTTQQIVIGGTLQGDLGNYGFKTPWAEDGVQAIAGVEYRRDELSRESDSISQIPGGMGLTGVGGGTLDIAGEVEVVELFFETQIPLIEGRPFFEEFGINGAFRYSDYNVADDQTENSFSTETFSAGISWAPTADLRFRGQFQRAVRAPNVFELFTGQNTGLFSGASFANGLFDPCAGDFVFTDGDGDGLDDIPEPFGNAAQCANLGVSAAQFGTVPDNAAGQLNTVTGGNPFLDPEVSDTYTAGAIFTPSFFPGFTLAVDYFNIALNDAIQTIPGQEILQQCLDTGSSTFCDLAVRDAEGSLFLSNTAPGGGFAGLQLVQTNIASLETQGIDFQSTYSYDFGGMGSVNFNYASTYLIAFDNTSFEGADVNECAGLYGGACNTAIPNPRYRHRLLTTWQTPWNVDVTTTWRYQGGVTAEGSAADGTDFGASLDAANYVDLSAQWYANERASLRFGIQNLLGRDPEITATCGPPFCNGNTIPGVYDAAGRYIFVGINLTM